MIDISILAGIKFDIGKMPTDFVFVWHLNMIDYYYIFDILLSGLWILISNDTKFSICHFHPIQFSQPIMYLLIINY